MTLEQIKPWRKISQLLKDSSKQRPSAPALVVLNWRMELFALSSRIAVLCLAVLFGFGLDVSKAKACDRKYPFVEAVDIDYSEAFIDTDTVARVLGIKDFDLPPRKACDQISVKSSGSTFNCLAQYGFTDGPTLSLLSSNLGHRALDTDRYFEISGKVVFFDRVQVDSRIIDFLITRATGPDEVYMLAAEGNNEIAEQQRSLKLWPAFAKEVYVCD